MKNSFLTNYSEETFLEHLRENLRTCKSFCFSVSFIKKAGLVLLARDLEAALQRGCNGKIITSTYQNFTDIESLRTFFKFAKAYNNFECHLDYESFQDVNNYTTLGFHTKGYLFVFDDYCEVTIGSSNITRFALLKNLEWDLVLQENLNSELYSEVQKEYDSLWAQTPELTEELIKKYTSQLAYAIERWDMDYDVFESAIKPNYMQRNALKELARYRAMGISRAMIVCSAGSGKTYLSAFDALNFGPKKLLYIVHESSILKKAMETYQNIFDNDITFGLFNGENKDIDADFLFSTNVSMSQNLELFSKDEFDYIVIDECHHAVADSYKKIIEYFDCEFMLGLTATPERMDDQDVFELFDENVPYELRLRDSIKNRLVVPFHYYGIRDQLIDYDLSKSKETKLINQICDDRHIEFIHEQIEKFRQPGKLKALVFCRNRTHAMRVATALNEECNYKTAYLTGKHTVGERLKAYEDLQKDEDGSLEILCTVDILNEGVDIPGVNLVVFLRPTESSTVFIQQLGRGLRKFKNKKFVTVLDFIGNSYKRSTQIALALGSLSENLVLEKKLMIKMVSDDFETLGLHDYGVEIHLDDLSKEEIINYLETENFNLHKYLERDYYNFKDFICSKSYPRHIDYLNNDCAPDLLRFMSSKLDGKKTSCYYNFLKSVSEEDLPVFTDKQIKFIKYASGLLPLTRTYEYDLLKLLIDGKANVSDIHACLKSCDDDTFQHVLRLMLKDQIIRADDNLYSLNIEVDDDFKDYMTDLIEYGLIRYQIENGNTSEGLPLWNSYTKEGVLRYFLEDPSHNQLGTYYIDDKVVIFVTLIKDEGIKESLNYNDKYLTENIFQWESKNDLAKGDLEKLNNSKEAYVFIRKCEEENGVRLPFTYVGKGKLTNPRETWKNGTYIFDIVMENSVDQSIMYDFDLTGLMN